MFGSFEDAYYEIDALWHTNDKIRLNFNQIADFIEKSMEIELTGIQIFKTPEEVADEV